MKRRRWMLLLVALLVGAAAAVALWPRASGPLKASVQFLAYTNLPDGSRAGLFVLRNGSAEKLQWAGGYTFNYKNGNRAIWSSVSHPAEVIPAGGSTVLLVPRPPEDLDPWGFACGLMRCGLRARLAERLARNARSVGWQGRAAHWLTPKGGTSVSCECEPIER